jgi:hypothetical protein
MEEKKMWEQKLEKEKEYTVFKWDHLRKKEKMQQSCIPNCCHGREGGKGTSDNEEEYTDDVATVSTKEETKNDRQNIDS